MASEESEDWLILFCDADKRLQCPKELYEKMDTLAEILKPSIRVGGLDIEESRKM